MLRQGLGLVNGQCKELALGDGPAVLRALYGGAAKWIFAIALLLSGIASMVTVTLGSQATWEGFSGQKVIAVAPTTRALDSSLHVTIARPACAVDTYSCSAASK